MLGTVAAVRCCSELLEAGSILETIDVPDRCKIALELAGRPREGP